MEGSKLLGVKELRNYLNSNKFDEGAIVCLFDINDGTRHDLFADSLDYLEADMILDINIGG